MSLLSLLISLLSLIAMKVSGLAIHPAPVGVPSKKAVVGWRHSNIPIVGSTSHIVIVGGHITLPAPKGGKDFYSRSEAANIIYSAGPSGYHLRGKVSARMVELKRVPVGRKSLTDLMLLRDGGKPIEDDPWRRKSKAKADGGCGGIQSSKLDAVAGSNYKYLIDTLQYHVDGDGNWHAHGCSNKDLKSGKCQSCRSAYKNMTPDRHPQLFCAPTAASASATDTATTTARPTSPTSVIPAEEDIGRSVEERLKVIANEDITTDPELKYWALLIHHKGIPGVEIDGSQMFRVCQNCKDYSICQKRVNNSDTCPACARKRSCKKWQQERRKANFDQRTHPQSKTNWTKLTPPELSARSANLKDQRRVTAAKIKSMSAKLEASRLEMELSDEFAKHLEEALDHAVGDRDSFDAGIKEALRKILKDEADAMGVSVDDNKWTEEETNDLCDYVAEAMKNHIHKIDGKPHLYSFSPKTTGMAMCQLLRSGKSTYNLLKGDYVVVMPGSKGLSEKKQMQKITDGDCVVSNISPWRERRGSTIPRQKRIVR